MMVMVESLVMGIDPGTCVAEDPDLLLVQRFVRGDASAYDQLVEKHQVRLTRLAYRLLGWQADVEDVVQEVFLAALRGLPRFRGSSSVGTWLTTITLNMCRTYRRRRRWVSLAGLGFGDPGPGDLTRPCPEQAPADQPLLDREKLERVRRVVERLPARDREVIVLCYLEQMSVARMAEVLSVRPANIQVRLHRARARLKEHLEDLVRE